MAEAGLAASLNTNERRALMLLAAGHTAKTAATELGTTESAVNERLREARRKTGVGSSRELARLLAAQTPQENRDEEIGLATAPGTGDAATTDLPHPAAGRSRKGFVVMSFLLLTGAAAMLIARVQRPDGASADPLLADLVATSDDTPRSRYAELRSETRDPRWAPDAEAALLNRFGAVPGIVKLRVTCGATLCEVAGLLPPAGTMDEAALRGLQDLALTGLGQLGFEDLASMAVGQRASSGAAFAIYPRRSALAGQPTVVRSVPKTGSAVAAGPLALSVTFDRPMRRDSYSFTSVDGARTPDCDPVAEVSADARTFTLRCTTAAGTTYAIGINHGRFHNFAAAANGVPAKDTILGFSTR